MKHPTSTFSSNSLCEFSLIRGLLFVSDKLPSIVLELSSDWYGKYVEIFSDYSNLNVIYKDFENNEDVPTKGDTAFYDFQQNQEPNQSKIYFGHNKLPPPMRPDFLGKKADVYPMQHMISMVNAPIDPNKTQIQLKNQIEDTIARIKSCKENEEEDNEGELKQLNSQLKSLMDQVNMLLSQMP